METVCLFFFFGFSIILDSNLCPLDSLTVSLFVCQLSCPVPVTDFLLVIGAPRINSSNFDRIFLPNIKQNGARITPVVI